MQEINVKSVNDKPPVTPRKDRSAPGGTLPQRLTGMAEKLGECWLGADCYALWKGSSSASLSTSEKRQRCNEIWNGLVVALHDPTTTAAVVTRIGGCFDLVEVDIMLQNALRFEVRERLDQALLTALRVRQGPRRGTFGRRRNGSPWIYPVSPSARLLLGDRRSRMSL